MPGGLEADCISCARRSLNTGNVLPDCSKCKNPPPDLKDLDLTVLAIIKYYGRALISSSGNINLSNIVTALELEGVPKEEQPLLTKRILLCLSISYYEEFNKNSGDNNGS